MARQVIARRDSSRRGAEAAPGAAQRRPEGNLAPRYIDSPANALIKQLKSLFGPRKFRDRHALFAVEGMKLVREGLTRGWPCRYLVAGPPLHGTGQMPGQMPEQINDLHHLLQRSGGQLVRVSEKVLCALSRRDNPQMAIGVFEQRLTDFETLASRKSVLVALDRIRDPGNLGTIIRTVDAAGAGGVILIGHSTDPFSIECTRASMGAIFSVPLAKCKPERFLALAGATRARLVGTACENGMDYRDIAWRRDSILLMGNEQAGLDVKLASGCAHVARIPQRPGADSLNVAIAAALVLYQCCFGNRDTCQAKDVRPLYSPHDGTTT